MSRQALSTSPPTVIPTNPVVSFLKITGVNPAPGAQWSIAVPANTFWRVLFGSALLTASAAVANREFNLEFLDAAANKVWFAPFLQNQTAGQPVIYCPASGIPNFIDMTQLVPTVGIPALAILGPGYSIISAVVNMQAADQWSKIFFHVLAASAPNVLY